MRCIQCHSPFFPSVYRSRFRRQSNAARLLRPRRKPMAIATTALVLAAASPAKSGDISVLLQTSAVLLFAYGIANFVVPEIILKDLQTSKDQNPSDDSPSETGRRSEGSKKK